MSVIEDFRKPFNLISTGIAVFSVLLSIYFYADSLQKREPYYLVHPSSQIFSKAGSSSKITVTDSVGKPVTGDIHVLELSFWNNGKLPIERSDVRTPIIIQLPEGYRLLESKVVRENKPAVTKFELIETQEVTPAPRVQLHWEHLDPGLGARLQFIYVGDPNPKLAINGDILDAQILDGSSLLKRLGAEWVRLLGLTLIVVIGMGLVNSIEVRRQPNGSRWLAALIALGKITAIGACMVLAFWLLFSPKSAPI